MESSGKSNFKRPLVLWIALGIFLFIDIFLFIAWRDRNKNLDQGFQLLMQSSLTSELIESQSQSERFLEWNPSKKYSEVLKSKQKLNLAIQKLLKITESKDEKEYFHALTPISKSEQEELISGIRQYHGSVSQLLEENILPRHSTYAKSYQRVKSILRQWYQDKSALQEKKLQPRLDTLFNLYGSYRISIKDSVKIAWAVNWYQDMADITPDGQLKQSLNKLNSLVTDNGNLVIYNSLYSLNALTPAELEMICKQVLKMENQVDNHLFAVVRKLPYL